MPAEFIKFPTTPHLLWLGQSAVREDKVLTRAEAESFLSEPVTVEEKVDGANVGISFDSQGNSRVQNRGNLVPLGTQGQFAPLWIWLEKHENRLFDFLQDRLILFGEWCYARHSIYYTQLPDFFLAFDIFDKCEQRFLCSPRRDEIVLAMAMVTVPKLRVGAVCVRDIPGMIGQSSLYEGLMEGIYLRRENVACVLSRAKVVRPQFVQQIGEHWSKQLLVPNRLRDFS